MKDGRSPFTITDDGSRLLWREAGGVSFLLGDCPKPPIAGAHHHQNTRLSFLVSGAIREVDDKNRAVERGPHTLHMSPAWLVHRHIIESPRLTTLCFDLTPDLLKSIEDPKAVFADPAVIKSGPTVSLMTRLYREMLAKDTASDLVLQGLVYEIAGELVRRKNGRPASDPPSWLRKARELLRERTNENISVVEVARAVGVHPSYLTRMFRLYLNESPGEYLRRVRMERATRQVLLTDTPLKMIAELAGFADQAHFSREFRRFHGHSPQRLRREIRG